MSALSHRGDYGGCCASAEADLRFNAAFWFAAIWLRVNQVPVRILGLSAGLRIARALAIKDLVVRHTLEYARQWKPQWPA
jgi:hypothetical protein